MRFKEYRQSQTSPIKYRLELRADELEKVKHLVMQIIERIKQDEKEQGNNMTEEY